VGVSVPDQLWSDAVGSRQKLPGSSIDGGGENRGGTVAEEKTGHHQGVKLVYALQNTRRERQDHTSRHFATGMQRADDGVLGTARSRSLDLQVQPDFVLAAEGQDLLYRGDAFAGKGSTRFMVGSVKPRPRVELAQFLERARRDRAVSVGGSLERIVVQSDEAGVARELQVGFNEASAHLHSFAKSGQGILWRKTRSSPMGNHPHL
jgi:hypothetical protein